jgi:hypothetical protein
VANVQLLQGILELEPVQVVVKFLQPLMMSIPPVEELGQPYWKTQYTNPEQGAKEGGQKYMRS